MHSRWEKYYEAYPLSAIEDDDWSRLYLPCDDYDEEQELCGAPRT